MLRYSASGAVVGAAIRCVSDPTHLLAHILIRERRFALALATACPRNPKRGKNGWTPEYSRQVPGRSPAAGAPCRALAPPGSNLRADGSMICAQAGADKVSGRRAGTLPAAPSLSLLWAASGLLRWPGRALPSQDPRSTLLPTLSLFPRGSIVSLGRAAAGAGKHPRVMTPARLHQAHPALL